MCQEKEVEEKLLPDNYIKRALTSPTPVTNEFNDKLFKVSSGDFLWPWSGS